MPDPLVMMTLRQEAWKTRRLFRLPTFNRWAENWLTHWRGRQRSNAQSRIYVYGVGASSASRQQVPEGWKLVPIEPTTEMCLAEWNVGMSDAHSATGVSACAWAAMLAAAPEYQPEDEDGVRVDAKGGA